MMQWRLLLRKSRVPFQHLKVTTRRCFQSRAEYEQWTTRMKASRMIINNDDPGGGSPSSQPASAAIMPPANLKQVSVKEDAPFLYSVSPISDRLLLYAYEEESVNVSADGSSAQSTPTGTTSSSIAHGKSPYSSLLEYIYPLSEQRYLKQEQQPQQNKMQPSQDQHAHETNSTEMSQHDTTKNQHHAQEIDVHDLHIIRASVSDLGAWSSVRLAKFYSDVDALTADVAYRHAAISSFSSPAADVAFVTAGHYHSRKIRRTDLSKDIILRCYPTNAGRSSIEIRTDALQKDEDGKERLLNVCFTSMVAVDKKTLRPAKNMVPKLIFHGKEDDAFGSHNNIDADDGSENCIGNDSDNHRNRIQNSAEEAQKIRMEMAIQHAKIRKKRYETSMQLLHGPSSSPPTQHEMNEIHILQQRAISQQRHQQQRHHALPHVHQHTYRSSVVVYPEKRNVHGKLFGGFVMEQGHILAQYAADFYLNHYNSSCHEHKESDCAGTDTHTVGGPKDHLHHEQKHSSKVQPHDKNTTKANDNETKIDRAIPLGLDEAIFLQPVSIGDHVTFTARVVHSTIRTCRVIVIVEVRNLNDRNSPPLRSNRLSFLFGGGGNGFPDGGIVPDSYREILMHVDAKRRAAVEGPLDEEVEKILNEGLA